MSIKTPSKTLIKAVSVLVGCGISFFLGVDWEKFREYETYVYHFSMYSRHLRSLSIQQNIRQLTNDVILFDEKFNSRQSPRDLHEVLIQMLKTSRPTGVEADPVRKP